MFEPLYLDIYGLRTRIRAEVFLPSGREHIPVFYLHEPVPEKARQVWKLLYPQRIALICLNGSNWNRDMSPWAAKRVFYNDTDFDGKASSYLEIMVHRIIPAIENKLGVIPSERGITGYSLGGLFALYAMTKTGFFRKVASVSGSLWFDNWIKYISTHAFVNPSSRIYLSVGNKEKRTKNKRMEIVEENTIRTAEILKTHGADVFFEINNGNHFSEIPERIAKAIGWLTEEKNRANNANRPQVGLGR